MHEPTTELHADSVEDVPRIKTRTPRRHRRLRTYPAPLGSAGQYWLEPHRESEINYTAACADGTKNGRMSEGRKQELGVQRRNPGGGAESAGNYYADVHNNDDEEDEAPRQRHTTTPSCPTSTMRPSTMSATNKNNKQAKQAQGHGHRYEPDAQEAED